MFIRATPSHSFTDHLGTTRASFAANYYHGGSSYYPYGLPITEGAASAGPGRVRINEYTAQEREHLFGLNWTNHGARFYDPLLSRWHAVDAKAEGYAPTSPYNYVLGNPISLVDQNGMDPVVPDAALREAVDRMKNMYQSGPTYWEAHIMGRSITFTAGSFGGGFQPYDPGYSGAPIGRPGQGGNGSGWGPSGVYWDWSTSTYRTSDGSAVDTYDAVHYIKATGAVSHSLYYNPYESTPGMAVWSSRARLAQDDRRNAILADRAAGITASMTGGSEYRSPIRMVISGLATGRRVTIPDPYTRLANDRLLATEVDAYYMYVFGDAVGPNGETFTTMNMYEVTIDGFANGKLQPRLPENIQFGFSWYDGSKPFNGAVGNADGWFVIDYVNRVMDGVAYRDFTIHYSESGFANFGCIGVLGARNYIGFKETIGSWTGFGTDYNSAIPYMSIIRRSRF